MESILIKIVNNNNNINNTFTITIFYQYLYIPLNTSTGTLAIDIVIDLLDTNDDDFITLNALTHAIIRTKTIIVLYIFIYILY